jgi:hypothetical protein
MGTFKILLLMSATWSNGTATIESTQPEVLADYTYFSLNECRLALAGAHPAYVSGAKKLRAFVSPPAAGYSLIEPAMKLRCIEE